MSDEWGLCGVYRDVVKGKEFLGTKGILGHSQADLDGKGEGVVG